VGGGMRDETAEQIQIIERQIEQLDRLLSLGESRTIGE